MLLLGGPEFWFGEINNPAARVERKENIVQWLIEGGLDYAYGLSSNINVHLGGNLRFRPGQAAFSVMNNPTRLELSGLTLSAYTGLSFMFYEF